MTPETKDDRKRRLKREAQQRRRAAMDPDVYRAEKRRWHAQNREKSQAASHRWHSENQERASAYAKAWYEANRAKVIERTVQNNAHRRAYDLNFRLAENLRSRLAQALRHGYKTGSAVRDLGCTILELNSWLERWFMLGMSWENYGSAWHIDHCIPLNEFDLSDPDQVQIACHWLNLQPLWARDNLRKGSFYPEPDYH